MNDTTLKISQIPKVYDEEDAKYEQKFYLDTYSTIDQIIPRLYLSNDCIARNRKILNDHKITHILNLTTNIQNEFESEITYKKLMICDFEGQNISLYFDEVFEFIDTALQDENNSVLVHCNAGISRSASFIIFYLMRKKICKNYQDALAFTRLKRHVVNPNKGFQRQLIKMEKNNKFRCRLM